MADLIHLLPDSVANQIAAGEVIQRPASAVKEILENAIDSGADRIDLIIKDAGKTLIQISDNGCGMSEVDARMAFERHATSKIRTVEDLFRIRTMGFRGEALASIAAIAQVEMKTRRHEDELGTHIILEASEVKSQEYCHCPPGTTLMIKNLFFNVPARRKFLKSDPVELRNIIEEFQRIALAHPHVNLSLYNDRKLILQLKASNLRQRIVNIFGSSYDQKLIPVEQKLDTLTIRGFIGKPEFARKQRGEQYFFVNNRFVRHPYLSHAVESAYEELLPEKSYPSYFIFIDIDPSEIDVNIHPTKTEIKFEDEKLVYSILRSTVKASLGKFHVMPTIDFDVEPAFIFTTPPSSTIVKPPEVPFNPAYNPFETTEQRQRQKNNRENWEKLFIPPDKPGQGFPTLTTKNELNSADDTTEDTLTSTGGFLQLHRQFIVTQVKSGLLIIDQQRAHERILYERYLELLQHQTYLTQQVLFANTFALSPVDAELLNEILDHLNQLGFNIKPDTEKPFHFLAEGVPAGVQIGNISEMIENIVGAYKEGLISLESDKKTLLARSLAKNLSIKKGKILQEPEMRALTEELFACRMPELSPDGEPTLKILPIADLF